MILLGILLGYIVSGLLLARHVYPRLRPVSVPVSCKMSSPYHEHYSACYRQPGKAAEWYIDSQGEAVTFALLGGLLWPVLLIGLGLRWTVTAGNDRQSPDELQARIHELESQLGIK